MHKLSDEALFEIMTSKGGRKKQKAFNCLYARYSEPLTQYFYFALRHNEQMAKDFCHDLFLKILERPELFDTSKIFKPWLYRVASNMLKNYYRRTDIEERYQLHVTHTSDSSYELTNDEKLVKKGIKELNEEQRALIVLRFKLQLSIKEIADIYECPEGTIKSRLFYATKELTKKVTQYE